MPGNSTLFPHLFRSIVNNFLPHISGLYPIYIRLTVSEPIDLDGNWPSSYADGGSVGWSKVYAGEDGLIEVSYPAVRYGKILPGSPPLMTDKCTFQMGFPAGI